MFGLCGMQLNREIKILRFSRMRSIIAFIGTWIFLNADGKNGTVSKELKAVLDYVAGRSSEDVFVKKLEYAVEKAKENREWRREYMTLLMRDRENQKIGKILGAISVYRDLHLSDEEIMTRIKTKFELTEEQARAYFDEAE